MRQEVTGLAEPFVAWSFLNLSEAAWPPPEVGLRANEAVLTQKQMSEKSLTRSGDWRLRFDADAVVHRSTNPLFAAKITLGGLDRNVPEQKLDLVQFSPAEWHNFAHERRKS